MRSGKSYYELLDVRRDATPSELRRGYEQALARANRDGATRHMVDLVAAYEVLSDHHRRRVYDETGLGVVPERVPNTHGRAVPWRGGSLGFAAPHRRSGAPARMILPMAPARRRWGRSLVAVVLVAGAGAASALLVQQQREKPASPVVWRIVPASAVTTADGRVQVFCPPSSAGSAYLFWARPGQQVSCENGATPSWRARIRR